MRRDVRDYIGEAERYATRGLDGDHGDHEARMRCIAYAQVMATLAVASATDALNSQTVMVEQP